MGRTGPTEPTEPAGAPGRAARRLVNVLHPRDNVATALVELAPGTRVDVPVGSTGGDAAAAAGTGAPYVEAQGTIQFGHKIALRAIGRPRTV